MTSGIQPKAATPSGLRRKIITQVVITLAAWLVAYLIVLALLLLAGKQLQSLPPALDALIFTGILVPIMGNVIMPLLSRRVARRQAAGER